MADRLQPVLMEDVAIIFRNFEGKEGEYNTAGNRNFGVIIPDRETAEAMMHDGWNIKQMRQRDDDEEGEEPPFWLPVAISWKNKPPRCVMITSRGRTNLDEDTVELLDWVDIKTVDLIVNPYSWSVRDATGVKAYVKSLFVTIEEDPLDLKYGHLPQQGPGALPMPDEPLQLGDGGGEYVDATVVEDTPQLGRG
jgi:hypothetical protein